MRNKIYGLLGEYLAMLIYLFKFYKIIAHRKRNFCGEIDFIAKRFKKLVFVEVKYRTLNNNNYNYCSNNQIKRIKNAALIYINQNPQLKEYQIRFDLVIIRRYTLPKIITNI